MGLAKGQEANESTSLQVARTVFIKNGFRGWPQGTMPEKGFIRHLDELLEIKPGRSPANYLILLLSPHRNGNSHFMRSVLAKAGADRMVAKLAVEDSGGRWSSEQYPRLLEAVLPDYRKSAHRRQLLRRRYAPLKARLQFFALDVMLPALTFLATEIVMAFSIGNSTSQASALPFFLRQISRIPLWSHLVGLLVALGVDQLHRKRETFVARFGFGDQPDHGFRLSTADREFLRGREKGPRPFVDQLHSTLSGPAILWVDRADSLDTFSREALDAFLLRPPSSNRVVVLHFPDREALWYRDICRSHFDLAHPEERLAEIHLERVSQDDRKAIAAGLGKAEDDAIAVALIADLVQVDQPRILGLRRVWQDLLEGELAQPSTGSDEALLLALLASAGKDGPRQFGAKELVSILVRGDSTFSRWAAIFGKKPWVKHGLTAELESLRNPNPMPLIERREVVDQDVQWVVLPDVRRAVLQDLENRGGWAGAVHGFWATYWGERRETEEKDRLGLIVDLSYHLTSVRFPGSVSIINEDAAQSVGRSLLSTAVWVIHELIEFAQFDRAHAILVRMREEVLPVDILWHSEPFVREVERLSEEAWRVAAVRGASQEILALQKTLRDRGARTAAKGIEVSLAIYELYSRSVALEEISREQAMALRIVGGDEATRARLENLRRYALNLDLLRRSTLVLEGLELFDRTGPEAAGDLLTGLLDPVPAPKLDFFELLVGFQAARARMALNDIAGSTRLLRRTVDRLLIAQGARGKYDLFEEAVWYLCLAEAKLVVLEACFRLGRYVLDIEDDFREVLSTAFKVNLHRVSWEDLIAKLAEEVAGSLEDAHLFQELFELSLGLAYLSNARVRYGRLLTRLSEGSGAAQELGVWESGVQIAKDLACKHLEIGTLLVRSMARREVETCTACLKIVCEEALRQGLEQPLEVLGPEFADLVIKINDKELYRVASEILRFVLHRSDPPADDGNGQVSRCEVGYLFAQFVRLLGDPRTALTGLTKGLALDPVLFQDEEARERARECLLSSLLQACWCYQEIGDDANLDRCLAEIAKVDGYDRWSGFPHVALLRFRRGGEEGNSPEDRIKEVLHALGHPVWRTSYEQRGLLKLVSALMLSTLESNIQGRTRASVVDAARVMIDRISEWFGIETATSFLALALQFKELNDPHVQSLYEGFFAREAQMKDRLARLDQQLGGGQPEILLEYILRRFSHRIVWLDQPERPAQPILEQIEKDYPAIARELTAGMMARAQVVQVQDGNLYVDAALQLLLQYQEHVSQEGNSGLPLQCEVGSAVWSVTEHLLHVIAKGNFVHPMLAEAMLTYLHIAEAFRRGSEGSAPP